MNFDRKTSWKIMVTDYDLEYGEVEKIDQELRELIDVEFHPPFLEEEFSDLFMETEVETPA